MATVSSVRFEGSGHDLKALILQWNAIPWIDIVTRATDYKGDCYDVTFTGQRRTVNQTDAESWVKTALSHIAD